MLGSHLEVDSLTAELELIPDQTPLALPSLNRESSQLATPSTFSTGLGSDQPSRIEEDTSLPAVRECLIMSSETESAGTGTGFDTLLLDVLNKVPNTAASLDLIYSGMSFADWPEAHTLTGVLPASSENSSSGSQQEDDGTYSNPDLPPLAVQITLPAIVVPAGEVTIEVSYVDPTPWPLPPPFAPQEYYARLNWYYEGNPSVWGEWWYYGGASTPPAGTVSRSNFYCPGDYNIFAKVYDHSVGLQYTNPSGVAFADVKVVGNPENPTNCFGVDVDIANGQGGAFVPEEDNQEELLGAFTVANLNDTDLDGRIDASDMLVRANPLFVGSQSELDLMQLRVSKPLDFTGQHGNNKLTLSISGNAKLWEDSTKRIEITERQFDPITNPQDPAPRDMTFWVEATNYSSSLRDIEITASYRGETDVVTATGVWSVLTEVAHELAEIEDLGDDPYAFNDLGNPPYAAIEDFGGVGLRPVRPAPIGVANAILFQFEVLPAGISQIGVVEFDVSRQSELKIWRKPWSPFGDPDTTPFVPGPERSWPGGDIPNDDITEMDESAAPTNNDHVYSFDAPGVIRDSGSFVYVMRANFNEFIRVGIGTDPTGNVLSGSRASEMVAWHARHRLAMDVDGDNKYKRVSSNGTQSGATETSDNDVGLGHIQIGNAP